MTNYPKLRAYMRDKYGTRHLRITTVIETNDDGTFHSIRLILKNDCHSFRIYSNWYVYDAMLLEAYPLPDRVINEIGIVSHRMKREHNLKLQTA
jgi:hypothetical protein